MQKVKQRMLEILDSLPEDCFDGKPTNEIICFLARRYIEIYGEDETTIIPGTDKHFTVDDFPKTSIEI